MSSGKIVHYIICIRRLVLPFDAVCGSKDVSIVYKHATAVKPIKIRETNHPWELVCGSGLSAHNSTTIISFTTT
jgi:hypothetical protein